MQLVGSHVKEFLMGLENMWWPKYTQHTLMVMSLFSCGNYSLLWDDASKY